MRLPTRSAYQVRTMERPNEERGTMRTDRIPSHRTAGHLSWAKVFSWRQKPNNAARLTLDR